MSTLRPKRRRRPNNMSLDLRNAEWLHGDKTNENMTRCWIEKNIVSKPPFHEKSTQHIKFFQPLPGLTESGNFGIVDIVKTELSDGKKYALKKIPFGNFGSAENGFDEKKQFEEFRRLRRELKILQMAEHNNIVTWYTTFVGEKSVYVVMEYLNGGNLKQAAQKSGRFPVGVLECVLRETVSGLYYLKSTLTAPHRDIKPSNILVNLSGEIKICDFGMSKMNENQAKSAALKSVFIGATQIYITPELMDTDENEIDYFQSDVYVLGIILMELSYGFYPLPMIEENILKTRLKDYPPGEINETLDETNLIDFIKLMSCFNDLENPPAMVSDTEYFPTSFVRLVNLMIKIEVRHRPTYEEIVEMIYFKQIGDIKSIVSEWIHNINKPTQ